MSETAETNPLSDGLTVEQAAEKFAAAENITSEEEEFVESKPVENITPEEAKAPEPIKTEPAKAETKPPVAPATLQLNTQNNTQNLPSLAQLNEAETLLALQLKQASNIDWQKLIDDNPQEYLRQKHELEERHNALEQVRGIKSQIEAQERQSFEAELQNVYATEAQKLQEALPEWKDPEVAKTDQKALRDYLGKLGYDDKTLANIYDHREIVIARKAMLYDKIIAEQNNAQNTVREKINKLPPVKTERAGGGSVPEDQAALARLRKSGSLEDAAALLAARALN